MNTYTPNALPTHRSPGKPVEPDIPGDPRPPPHRPAITLAEPPRQPPEVPTPVPPIEIPPMVPEQPETPVGDPPPSDPPIGDPDRDNHRTS